MHGKKGPYRMFGRKNPFPKRRRVFTDAAVKKSVQEIRDQVSVAITVPDAVEKATQLLLLRDEAEKKICGERSPLNKFFRRMVGVSVAFVAASFLAPIAPVAMQALALLGMIGCTVGGIGAVLAPNLAYVEGLEQKKEMIEMIDRRLEAVIKSNRPVLLQVPDLSDRLQELFNIRAASFKGHIVMENSASMQGSARLR